MPYGIHTRGSPCGLHTVDSDYHTGFIPPVNAIQAMASGNLPLI